MNWILIKTTDLVLDFTSSVFDWLYNLIGLPSMPEFLSIGLSYVLSAVETAVGLVSFIFPSETIWITYISFIIDLQLAYLAYLLFKFITNLYMKLKL